jgi:hypothetical protein
LVSVLANEPAQGLGCEVDKEELEKGRHTLENGGQAPCKPSSSCQKQGGPACLLIS